MENAGIPVSASIPVSAECKYVCKYRVHGKGDCYSMLVWVKCRNLMSVTLCYNFMYLVWFQKVSCLVCIKKYGSTSQLRMGQVQSDHLFKDIP